MSDAKRSDSERRDPALARLLAEALHPPGAPGGAAGDAACPDAELLAAYADHGLDAQETARWESHFAGCARCQQILAVLTASGEEPLTDAELERLGRLVGTASVPAERGASKEKKIVIPMRPRTTWRWLAPVAGVAAAAALWLALRPMPPRGTPVLTAEKTTAEPSAAPDQSQIAEANVPPPPAAARREDQAAPASADDSRSVPQPQAEDKKEAAPQAQAAPTAPPAASETDRLAAPAQPQRDLSAEASAAPAAKANDAASATAGTASAAAAAPAPVPGGAAGGVGGGIAPGAATASGGRSVQAFAARNGIATLAKIAAPPVIFASPDRSVLWRIGLAGRIERSTDQGRTWQQQGSGVTTDLMAGAAPSNKVAWVAGRAGVILRTTDGEHWQRVAAPERPVNGPANGPVSGIAGGSLDSLRVAATDWTGVQASDALHATIVSAGRRLSTEDGGQTWKQQ